MSIRQISITELGAIGAVLLAEATPGTVVVRFRALAYLSEANAKSYMAAYPNDPPFAGHDVPVIARAALNAYDWKPDIRAAWEAHRWLTYNCPDADEETVFRLDRVAQDLRAYEAKQKRAA
jgi:hypothetical protein